ncbi:translation machinery-associated protein 16 [Exaiptasia diaphana]|uniref:Translation machinery-associated protein 16 n=1 Tax=Exaiptasia diaphana TaxID=2652724 RepID=A0A913XXW5_EXADI|nr:translation machinery-associated protein 16 [Exaiptasia diaphana]KXJ29284.1 Translation machinery-associated protein 16 [Exaiptasia diaphana]
MPKAFKVRSHTKKAIHPNSRKASQLARAAHRSEKLQQKKEERNHLIEAKIGEKCRWFHEHIDETKIKYTAEEVREMIEEYLHRFDAELQTIEQLNNAVKGRQGRIHASREDKIKTIVNVETELFNTGGLEIPDLTSAKNLKLFKEWNCDMKTFSPITMKSFVKLPNSTSKTEENSIEEQTTVSKEPIEENSHMDS